MSYKRKITLILILNFVLLFAGTSIAYCNTRTFGFDENAKLITVSREKITFMDFEISKNSVKNFFEDAKNFLPDKAYNATPNFHRLW